MSDSEEKGKQDKEFDVFEFTEKEDLENASDHSSTGSPVPPGTTEETTGGSKNKNKPKTKRKRMLKDVNAPKAPLSGYVRFLNENREKFREENPELVFHEITKLLGQRWSSMSGEEKQHYLDEAEKEREEYQKAKEGYEKSEKYKEFQQLKKRKKEEEDEKESKEEPSEPREQRETRAPRNKTDRPKSVTPKCNGETTSQAPSGGVSAAIVAQGPRISVEGSQIPIFTEQFLEYNRKREADLRQLRKHNAVYEEQNAVLNKQIDHMKSVMDRVKSEIIDQENENSNMQNYLEKIRRVLTEKFDKISFPDAIKDLMRGDDNVDKKLAQLADYISTGKGEEVTELKRKVKEVISTLDYPALKK